MPTSEVKALTLQLSSIVDVLEKRIDHAARQSLQVTQTLNQQSKQSLEATHRLVQKTLDELRQCARQAVAEGVHDAAQELDQTMRDGAKGIERTISQLDQRAQHMGSLYASHAWKTFVASAVGSLAIIAVAVYVTWQAHVDLKRSEWIKQINAAVDAGQLAPCPEGGLCVKVGNKWVRLQYK